MKKLLFVILLHTGWPFIEASFGQCTPTITPNGPLTFCPGGSVTLNATAGGVNYLWKRYTTTGQKGPSSSYIASSDGNYTVQITTSTGCSAVSSSVGVTLYPSSVITANGATGIGCLNGGMNLAAVATSGNSYQWRLNGNNISGATASTYSATLAGNYTCRIINGSCNVLSNTINAQYLTAGTNISGPSIFCSPAFTFLTASVGINSGNTYQWQLNNVDIPGANSSNYNNPPTTGTYRCRIQLGICNAAIYSYPVNLQSGVVPQIYVNTVAQGPPSQDLCGNVTSTLLIFDASSNQTYAGPESGVSTWKKNEIQLVQSGNELLSVVESGYYTVSFTTACGSSFSLPFTLRILNPAYPPKITTYSSFPACSPVTLYVDDGVVFNTHQWKLNGVNIPAATQSSYDATQAGNYSCLVSNDCGSLESEARYINIYSGPTNAITATSTKLCSNSTVTLSVPAGSNFSYRWRLNGAIIPGATSSTYTTSLAGSFDCKVYNTCGDTVYTTSVNLSLVNPPVAKITSPVATSTCSGSAVNLAANTGSGYVYRWLQNGSAISTTGQSIYTATSSGRYSVIITDANGCADTSEQAPVFFGIPAVTVSSNVPSPVCPEAYVSLTANVTNGIADTYQWKRNGVDIPGKTTATINVYPLLAGTYKVVVSNPCGSSTSPGYSLTLKAATPASITAGGPTGFCPPASVTLNANTGAGLSYQWYRTNSTSSAQAMLAGATGSTFATDSSGFYWVEITKASTGCKSVSNKIKTSRNGIVAVVSPSVKTAACSSLVLTANNAAGYSYQWRKNGSNISGATMQTYTATSFGDFSVAMTGGCGTSVSDESDIEIYNGPFTPAATQIYPSATSGCEGSGLDIGINRFILPGYVSNVSIQWLLNGSAYGAPVIPFSHNTVLYPAVSGNYSMEITNVCGPQTSNIVPITIYPLPPASITAAGPTTFCNGGSVVLNVTTAGSNTRQWRRNNQDINNATWGSYTANVAGSYTCVVTSTNGCKTISNEIDVVISGNIPSVQPASGSAYVCNNTSGKAYSIDAVAGATGYTWTVPSGATITSGQGTKSIKVSFGSTAANGNICVYATVPCGNGPSSCIPVRMVTAKPAVPSAILGSIYTCLGVTPKVYSCPTVLNATGYTWTVPANAVILSGQGTHLITVDFNSSFTSGPIKVAAFNCKGTSSSQSLDVYSKPVAPTVSGLTVGVCPGSTQTYTITTIAGATGFKWYAPSNASISGSQFNSSATLIFNANYVKDTLFAEVSNYCGVSPKTSVIVKTVPNIPSSISGPVSVCANQNGVGYSISPVNGATSYQWTVPSGATIASGQNTTSVSVNFGTTAGNVKVRSGNACGYSVYRNKAIAITCREGESTADDLFAIFPNPATDMLTVLLNYTGPGPIKIVLTDVTGRIMMQKNISHLEDGKLEIIDISEYSPGYYFLKVETVKNIHLEKVLIE